MFTNETTGRRWFEYLVGLNTPAQRYFSDFIDLMSLQGVKTIGIIAEDASFPAVRGPWRSFHASPLDGVPHL